MKHSKAGRSARPPTGKRWSNPNTPSNPSASASTAARSTASASAENIGRTSPTLGRALTGCRPTRARRIGGARRAPARLPQRRPPSDRAPPRGAEPPAGVPLPPRSPRTPPEPVPGADPRTRPPHLRRRPRRGRARSRGRRSPRPGAGPTEARTPIAAWSPARAAWVTIGPLTRSGSPPASCASLDPGWSRAASLPSRPIARPAATCSQQPRFPHPHRGPSGSTMMCPTSAANPCAPRKSRPSATIPPPMPVPTVIISRWFEPRPAPKRNSPHAATLASLSTTVGSPSVVRSGSSRGSSRQARFGANRITPSRVTIPAAPTPSAAHPRVPVAGPLATARCRPRSPGGRGRGCRRRVDRRPRRAACVHREELVPPASTPSGQASRTSERTESVLRNAQRADPPPQSPLPGPAGSRVANPDSPCRSAAPTALSITSGTRSIGPPHVAARARLEREPPAHRAPSALALRASARTTSVSTRPSPSAESVSGRPVTADARPRRRPRAVATRPPFALGLQPFLDRERAGEHLVRRRRSSRASPAPRLGVAGSRGGLVRTPAARPPSPRGSGGRTVARRNARNSTSPSCRRWRSPTSVAWRCRRDCARPPCS